MLVFAELNCDLDASNFYLEIKLRKLNLLKSITNLSFHKLWEVGSGNGAGLLTVPGRPTTFGHSRAGAISACSWFGMGAGVVFFFISSILSSLSYAPSLGRRLDMTAILWSRPLDLNGSCQLTPRAYSLSTG